MTREQAAAFATTTLFIGMVYRKILTGNPHIEW
jgi:hypothetical protein